MSTSFDHKSYDAIIIGARCAGAASAMLMARNGARVLMVDRDAELTDTMSTHALTRPAVKLLQLWGLLDPIIAAGTPVARLMQFTYGTDRIDVPIEADGAIEGLYAPRRQLLDGLLQDAAMDAGVEFHRATRFESVIRDLTGRVIGARLRTADGTLHHVTARMVIGADGRCSAVADAVKARTLLQSQDRAGVLYTYVTGLPNTGMRWFYGDRVFAGLIPTNGDAHCFFVAMAPTALAAASGQDGFAVMTDMLAQWDPDTAATLADRGPAEKLRRFAGAPAHLRDSAGPGWALVGDAGYYKDPATAHGITDAFLDAARLANALKYTPSEARVFQAERNQTAPAFFELTQKIAALDWDLDTIQRLHLELSHKLKDERLSLSDGRLPDALAA